MSFCDVPSVGVVDVALELHDAGEVREGAHQAWGAEGDGVGQCGRVLLRGDEACGGVDAETLGGVGARAQGRLGPAGRKKSKQRLTKLRHTNEYLECTDQ